MLRESLIADELAGQGTGNEGGLAVSYDTLALGVEGRHPAGLRLCAPAFHLAASISTFMSRTACASPTNSALATMA